MQCIQVQFQDKDLGHGLGNFFKNVHDSICFNITLIDELNNFLIFRIEIEHQFFENYF